MFNSVLSLLNKTDDLEVRSSLCGHSIANKFSCQLCTDNCPNDSLSWQDNHWYISDCNSCGKCVTVCPSHVFKLAENTLINSSILHKKPLLTCNVLLEEIANSCDIPIIHISCLNQIYPELLLYLLAKYGTLNIYINPEKCKQCCHFDYQALINNLNKMGDFKPKINCYKAGENSSNLITENEENLLNRRQFFYTMLKRGRTISQEVINESIAEYKEIFNKHSPVKSKPHAEKRLLLLMALQVFKQNNIPFTIKKLPYPRVQVEKCEFCGVCVRLCPNGALDIIEENDTKTLYYWPLKCTGCGLCKDICQVGIINNDNSLEFGDLLKKKGEVILAQAQAVNCKSCQSKVYFYPTRTEDTCYPCRLQSKIPAYTNPLKRWKSSYMS